MDEEAATLLKRIAAALEHLVLAINDHTQHTEQSLADLCRTLERELTAHGQMNSDAIDEHARIRTDDSNLLAERLVTAITDATDRTTNRRHYERHPAFTEPIDTDPIE